MNHKVTTLNQTYYNGTAVFNIFLIAAVLFLLIYYVIISNMITASRYKISLLNNKLSGLIETNGVLTAQKLSIEDSPVILNFIRSYNLVEATHITHIFESGDVALQR